MGVANLTVDCLAHLVGQIRMNAVEVMVPEEVDPTTSGPSISTVGIGLHFVASAVNHACNPNCTLQTALPELRGWAVLQAMQPLLLGEEITIAYMPAEPNRCESLREQWLFECSCEQCCAGRVHEQKK